MSETIYCDPETGLSVVKFAGPERHGGRNRTLIQITGPLAHQVMELTLDEFLSLTKGYWEIVFSGKLPVCLNSACQHGPPPHGKWTDCPKLS